MNMLWLLRVALLMILWNSGCDTETYQSSENYQNCTISLSDKTAKNFYTFCDIDRKTLYYVPSHINVANNDDGKPGLQVTSFLATKGRYIGKNLILVSGRLNLLGKASHLRSLKEEATEQGYIIQPAPVKNGEVSWMLPDEIVVGSQFTTESLTLLSNPSFQFVLIPELNKAIADKLAEGKTWQNILAGVLTLKIDSQNVRSVFSLECLEGKIDGDINWSKKKGC